MGVFLIGLDLATEANKCGICVLEEETPGHVKIARVPALLGSDGDSVSDALIDVLKTLSTQPVEIVLAIDAPLGWPADFVSALSNHAATRPFPVPEARKTLRYRETDLHIKQSLQTNPISVSTDRIGSTALVAAQLTHRLAENLAFCIDVGTGVSGPRTIIEVYPGATLRAWFGKSGAIRGYKKPKQNPTAIPQVLAGIDSLFPNLGVQNLKCVTDHEVDALVSALTASLYHKNDGSLVSPPATIAKPTLETEGWIWAPKKKATIGE